MLTNRDRISQVDYIDIALSSVINIIEEYRYFFALHSFFSLLLICLRRHYCFHSFRRH